ncbi:lytic transglycosylase domain-containing protein [Salmonella enterica]|uniref:Lytic transglycosylase domain-containing protein n=1 Tax=Salmonella enterica subsp. diarizonae serovar 48:i:z TaxID=1192842 RepID=A0A735RKA4_SALDZ|nr:lytic transglycosylase domain-containing protein [Salmonella enterica]ECE5796054.1 lytic transglycosylase domain-containing protein [Salmonella enterica subsp. diarizonae]ECU9996733.1 lytic transglycosylase domain-containing protein [Salmonella enterica subsp. diarizonae serovar 48:i:z]EBC8283158.1 lytic transglycosylase domain-containing protein [Salmonella enterica]EBH0779838.1 lytic transglycosylase domain-containing protein [Salmonella enterica]
MAAKSIIEVDVNDEKFLSFMDKFNEYQAALEELPEAWRASAQGIGDSARETSKASSEAEGMTKAFLDGVDALNMMVNNLDRINTSLDDANKRQSDLNKKTAGSSSIFGKLKKDSKEFAGHIKDATVSLLSWGGIVGLFTGVLGVGGLFGINRLASTASAQRFTSMGLNTSIGALDSTAINYQRAVANPTATLGAIRDTQADLSQRWKFQAMGINNPDRSPDQLLPEMIRAARSIFTQTGGTLQGANAYGLTSFFSIDDLNRFKNMSDAEIDAMEKRAKRDAQLLQITDEQARQWQDFNVQLDYSSQSIKNTFIRGLGPLTPGLTKLSDALSGAIDTVLQSPELGKWIDGLAGGIQRFGDYLASPDFKNDVENFMVKVEKLGKVIGKVVDWIIGKTNLSVDDIKSGSSILSDKPVVDQKTGQSYIPGSESDPNVSAGLKWLKRASGVTPTAYDSYFEEAAKKFDLDPKLLKSVAAAESSWDQNAVSKAGAQGLMQVMPMNFQPGENPFDPRDNIMAGARVMSWAKQQSGGDFDEMLRWYNGGKNRGSQENINYPGRVKDQYAAIYGTQPNPANAPSQETSEIARNTAKTNQLLQQAIDSNRNSGGAGVVVYNNTGGNAVVTSAQLGAR